MKLKDLRALIITLLILTFLPFYSSGVEIVTWNIMDFPGEHGSDRIDDYLMVLNQLGWEILVVQEMESNEGVKQFLKYVVRKSRERNKYKAAPFFDGPGTDNALFYKGTFLKLKSYQQIPTANRDITEYIFRIKKGNDKGKIFRVYSVHFTEGKDTEAKKSREKEALVLRNYLNSLPQNSLFVVCGTFNMLSSSEKAYEVLTEIQEQNHGNVRDPIQFKGSWHDNKKVSWLHTESTRRRKHDGGEGGGLDDRFDAIFASPTFEINRYSHFGNDGNHFNKKVTQEPYIWDPVPIDALYEASDHLPVVADVIPLSDEIMDQSQIFSDYGYWFERDVIRWQEFIPTINNLSSVKVHTHLTGNIGNLIVQIRDLKNNILGQQIIPEHKLMTWSVNWYKVTFNPIINLVSGQKYRIYVFSDRDSPSPDNRYFWRGSNFCSYLTSCKSDVSGYNKNYEFAFKTLGKR